MWDVIKPLADDNCPHPSGSFFLQLANTPSEWVRIGGTPKRCDTSQNGTARLHGRILLEDYSKWIIIQIIQKKLHVVMALKKGKK